MLEVELCAGGVNLQQPFSSMDLTSRRLGEISSPPGMGWGTSAGQNGMEIVSCNLSQRCRQFGEV